jgi:hypothetical protein
MNADRVRQHLERTRAGLEAALAAVSAENWRRSPGAGAWSAAEVVVHLTMIETRVQQAARKVLSREPRPLKTLQRLHIPTFVVAWRGIKRKTPIPLDNALLCGKAETLERHRACRGATLELLAEQGGAGSAHHWAHPFLGYLSFEQWMWLLGYHEVRHTKQIREIVSSFQK